MLLAGAAGSCELLSYLLVALVKRQDVFLPQVAQNGPRGRSRRQPAAPPVAAPHQEAEDGEEEEEDGQQHPGHPSFHPHPVPPSKEKIRRFPSREKPGVSSEEPSSASRTLPGTLYRHSPPRVPGAVPRVSDTETLLPPGQVRPGAPCRNAGPGGLQGSVDTVQSPGTSPAKPPAHRQVIALLGAALLSAAVTGGDVS